MENFREIALSPEAKSPYFVFFQSDGMTWKSLSKVMKANLLQATIIIRDTGIFVQEYLEGIAIFECYLKREKFGSFFIPTFENPESSFILLGINTVAFAKQLDSITKTDSLEIYVLASDVKTIHFEIIKKDGTRTSHRYMPLLDPVISNTVSAVDYQDHLPTCNPLSDRLYKVSVEAAKHSKTQIRIMAQQSAIMIKPGTESNGGFDELFGEWNRSVAPVFNCLISTPRFRSFAEMQKVTTRFIIYALPGLPLKMTADVGSLGTCSLYLFPIQETPLIQKAPAGVLNSNNFQRLDFGN